ncbi:hypothetical protein Cni_G25269 [Canna indica]|uniref:Pentatricopeptide repeat-containing protein n=1 Tax=Canna indica TaxID=4628 RepID=A0AAQ3KWQ5_9LILI|nr:hypothetical protein Cni_G25269 [Canna indica]
MRRILAAVTPPHRVLQSSAALFLHIRSPISTSNSIPLSPPPLKHSAVLTKEEFAAIRDLVPRLCDAGQHDTAVRLVTTALLTDPPLDSLPISSLADRLSTLPDMTAAMSLLTALRYHPRRPSPLPFCSALLSSYFTGHRHKEAAKVLSWLFRADSPCRPDAAVYRTAVEGFCWLGRMIEALRAVKEMVADGISPGSKLRESVYRGLLREARIDEALELNATLKLIEESGEGFDGALELLDRIIKEWEE